MSSSKNKGYQIEMVGIEKLIPYANNARKHCDEQVAQVAASIREFGFNNPVLIDKDNGIIAGHGRVLAARKLELEKVPCIRLDHLTDAQRRAYILADNRLAETGGGWDEELLKIEIEWLFDQTEFDVTLIGWTEAEIERMIQGGNAAGTAHQEWQGMPEFEQGDKSGIKCIVHFENDADKESFERLVAQKIPAGTKAIWYPYKEPANLAATEYSNE